MSLRISPWKFMNETQRYQYACERVAIANKPILEQLDTCWRRHDEAAAVGDVSEMGHQSLRADYLDGLLQPMPSPPKTPAQSTAWLSA